MIGISGSLIWSKTLMELILTSMVNFSEVQRAQLDKFTLLAGAPGIFSDLLRSVQMLKREWGAESNGKLLHLFIPSKTVTFVPQSAVDVLPLGRTCRLGA